MAERYLSFGLGLLVLIPLAWLMLKGVGSEPRGQAEHQTDAATLWRGSEFSRATGPSSC